MFQFLSFFDCKNLEVFFKYNHLCHKTKQTYLETIKTSSAKALFNFEKLRFHIY